jgi:amino acid adenylation domain-containing protein
VSAISKDTEGSRIVTSLSADVVRIAPASGLQRGLWFLDRWNAQAATYHVPWAFDFTGPVDLRLLEEALHAVIARHEILRTTFELHDEGLVQLVHDTVRAPFAVTDLRGLPADEQSKRSEQILATAAVAPFDLAAGPLLRATAVCRDENRVTMLLVVHHIVWDGGSAGLFEQEWSESYNALVADRPAVLPELTIQYADYAAQERESSFDGHIAYWLDHLAGVPTLLELPADRPRSSTSARRGRTEPFELPAGTAARVRSLAQAEGMTPFVVLLAAFALLLGRYTGASDLVIGTPVTTRTRPELENLVGYFVNLLPLRIRLLPAMTFRELLEHVQDVACDSLAYLDLPFDQIVDRLGLDRSAEHPPLVQVVFGAHAEDHEPVRFGQASATRQVRSNGTAKFDLTWSVFDDGELRGEAEYSGDLFGEENIRRLAADWREILAAVMESPGRPVWQLTVTAAAPRSAAPRSEAMALGRCVHTLFEDAADTYGHRTAVTSGTQSLTYAELDRRANQLAHALIAAGVRAGDRVGLLLERTVNIPACVLAVLKVGAAYVPADPAAPAERAAMAFGDTGVGLVLTDRPDRAPDGPWRSYELARQAAEIAAMPSARPSVAVRPGDIAYIIFTSGSTGRPKGVAIAHEHVSRLMTAGREHFGFRPEDVWTLFHSYAFDWTVWELWGALHHGSRLVIVPYVTSRSPEEFVGLLASERVSCLCLTPSALHQIEPVLRRSRTELTSLRWVMLGGEALDPAVVRRWFDLDPRPPATLCNLYGITETTVHVTTFDVAGNADGFQRSLIGDPMPHLTAMVLDDWLRPCPVGVSGELYIGGGALAHGYWGRPGLTAGRFVADPYAGTPCARMYRTGDVARRLPGGGPESGGGGLEYVGRTDFQVKLRGFRIELGEIENALAGHPDVQACAVVVRDQRLAAYVTGRVPERMREFLARSLPDYMIPASVTLLDALPMTVNRKVDRKALPTPDARTSATASADGYIEPRTAVEEAFAEIWSQVLEVDGVGVHDDFFHLGGDSIRAVQMAGRLRDMGWAVSLRDIFSAPTIARLGALARPVPQQNGVGEAFAKDGDGPFALISDADRAELPPGLTDAYPMVSMQLSMIFHAELAGGTANYHNVNSYRLLGEIDETTFRRAVADTMARHAVLRTSLDISGYSEPLQLVHGKLPVPVEFADLRGESALAQGDAVQAAFERHRQTAFDLLSPPLFRITVQHLGDQACQLTISEHHAILDGWSFTSMFSELLTRHNELADDPFRAAAPPPDSTFRDFVVIEREAASAPDSLEYWQRKLGGVSGQLWPGGVERDPADGAAGGVDGELPQVIERVLPRAPGQLKAVAAAARTPVKSVGLTAHLRALQQITGRRRITTGLAMNGRLERRGGADVYGLFLNTVPLTAEPGTDDLIGLVRAVYREELEMVPHRRVPFALLARMMADTRLDSQFGYLRFHALGRLDSARIVDGKIGSEPTLRHEPNSFAFGASLIQDPASERVLLAVDYQSSVVPKALADEFIDAYVQALDDMAASAGRGVPVDTREN